MPALLRQQRSGISPEDEDACPSQALEGRGQGRKIEVMGNRGKTEAVETSKERGKPR